MSTSPTPAHFGPTAGGTGSSNGHGRSPVLADARPRPAAGAERGDAPLTRLRAGRVEANSGRVGRVFVVGGLLTTAVLAAVFFVSGAQKNFQITQLRTRGVPVAITVDGCVGQLGGSGSNVAGYACTGTYTLDGHRYGGSIPGDAFHPPGTRIRGVAVPGDPRLLSTPAMVASERASSQVFVLPSVLAAAALAASGLLVRRRLVSRARPGPPPAP